MTTIANHAEITCHNDVHVIDLDGTWHHVPAGDDIGAVFRKTVHEGPGFSFVITNPTKGAINPQPLLIQVVTLKDQPAWRRAWTVRTESSREAATECTSLNEALFIANTRIVAGLN